MSVADDLAYMCSDAPGAVTLVWNGETTLAPLEMVETPRPDGYSGFNLQTETVLLLPVSVFVLLAIGDTLTVDGVTWNVRDLRRVDDGLLRHVFLAKVAP